MAHSRVGTRTRTGALLVLLVMGAFAIVPVWGAAVDGTGGLGLSEQILLGFAFAAGSASLVAHGFATGKRLRSEGTEMKRVRLELGFARSAQECFLPRSLPQVPGIDFWAANISANEVSGDCYDVFDGGAGRPIVLAIADVCGKGVPAALLTSAVHAVLHSDFLRDDYDLERTTQNLNRLVHTDARPGSFVTMVLAQIDRDGDGSATSARDTRSRSSCRATARCAASTRATSSSGSFRTSSTRRRARNSPRVTCCASTRMA